VYFTLIHHNSATLSLRYSCARL